jgi:hypothetical protein
MLKGLSLSLVTLFLAASTVHAYVSSETASVARNIGAVTFTEVKFNTGNSTLSEDQKKDIAIAISAARQKGKIDQVKVLAWSDKEYPQRNTKYDKADVDLAANRIQEVKSYLKDSLDVSAIHPFNMAERPTAVQKLFNTSNEKVKTRVESEDAVPATADETGVLGLKSQSSKVLILVFLKK